jgi:hypothetical protein
VNGADNFVAGQCFDHPLDVAPVAKAHDIPVAAESPSPRCRLDRGTVTVKLDQLGSIGKSKPPMDEDRVHGRRLLESCCRTADECRQRGVDYVFGIGCGTVMAPNTTRAGGCFLSICILAGFIVGLQIQNPMKGVLIGTAAGAAIAVLIWLIDRWRGGSVR